MNKRKDPNILTDYQKELFIEITFLVDIKKLLKVRKDPIKTIALLEAACDYCHIPLSFIHKIINNCTEITPVLPYDVLMYYLSKRAGIADLSIAQALHMDRRTLSWHKDFAEQYEYDLYSSLCQYTGEEHQMMLKLSSTLNIFPLVEEGRKYI